MGGAAAGLGHDAGDVVLVDVGGHGRGELAHHDDGVLGQRGEVHELLAQQVGEKAGLDVGDVGGALAEELVLHVGEHVVVHVVGLGDGLLGAHAALDGTVDHVTDALVLGELDVGAHDGGGLLADGLGHALDLGVGLLDELGDRGLITLLLGLGVLSACGVKDRSGSTATRATPMPMPSDALTPSYINAPYVPAAVRPLP